MQMEAALQLTNTHSFYKLKDKWLFLSKPIEIQHFTTRVQKNLLTGQETPFSRDSLESLLKEQNLNNQRIGFKLLVCFYELGELFELEQLSKQDVPLLLTITFESARELNGLNVAAVGNCELVIKDVDEACYEKKFDEVQRHLLDGDCYQLNLTVNHEIEIKSDITQLYTKFLNSELSDFAHSIFIKELDRLILSNSPECLFEIENQILRTRPIKGTLPAGSSEEELDKSEKNENELNIITDLLRNDLSRIGENFSRVVTPKAFMRVPGIIHQYSEIEVELEHSENLLSILKAMFPGGSITGAPKKRVVRLIKEIEGQERGIYTGSTILWSPLIKRSSINIRTADIDTSKKMMLYGSGGAITVKSGVVDEWHELKLKLSSFLKLFKKN